MRFSCIKAFSSALIFAVYLQVLSTGQVACQSYPQNQEDFVETPNKTAFTSETDDLLFKRSPKDLNNYFLTYRISKGNDSNFIIALGREQDEKVGKCVNDSMLPDLLDQCKKRYSLSYINDTYVSFRISNLTLEDSGLYICQTFFSGTKHDPEYAEINLSVKERPSTRSPETATTTQTHGRSAPKAKSGNSERPSTRSPETATTTQTHETSAPKAKSGNSDIQFSVTVSALVIFQALFQLFQ